MLVSVAAAVTVFVAVTLWALEWSGVATVRTAASGAEPRTTRVWYVAGDNGRIHLEAGGSESPWLADVRKNPEVQFDSAQTAGRYRATVRENPAGHERIRSELREKYGLRDLWVGLLVDTSSSSLVVLEPLD